MIEFDTTVRIGRTPGRVFSVLADFETYLVRWAKGPVAVVRTDGDGGDGSRYMITARVGPATAKSPYEVTGYASDLGRLKVLVEAEIPPS